MCFLWYSSAFVVVCNEISIHRLLPSLLFPPPLIPSLSLSTFRILKFTHPLYLCVCCPRESHRPRLALMTVAVSFLICPSQTSLLLSVPTAERDPFTLRVGSQHTLAQNPLLTPCYAPKDKSPPRSHHLPCQAPHSVPLALPQTCLVCFSFGAFREEHV